MPVAVRQLERCEGRERDVDRLDFCALKIFGDKFGNHLQSFNLKTKIYWLHRERRFILTNISDILMNSENTSVYHIELARNALSQVFLRNPKTHVKFFIANLSHRKFFTAS